MKYLNFSACIQPFLSSITRSIFSSTRHPKARTISNRLSRFRGPLVRLALAVVLVALTLSASMFERGRSTAAFSESISTVQSDDCTTPKSAWALGETACALATGVIDERRIIWVAPNGVIADVSTAFTGSASDTYTLLTTGDFAQYGTWTVRTVDNSGSGYAVASFLVRPATGDHVDLVVSTFGPANAIAGGGVSYRIEILNRGPNVAQSVVLTESSPNNTTFASEAQDPPISGVICGNPEGGQTGTSTCTIPSLAVNQAAVFTFVYNVVAGTPVGTIIVNTASVASSTNELFQNDNTAVSQVQVAPGTASPACTITCPGNISVNNSVSDPNPCVKTVAYTNPTAPGACADPDTGQIPAVVCSPPSGSNFPIGVSSVVCSTGATTCSFTITVNETRGTVTPTMTQPADVTANESSPGSGSARVNYPAPATTGNCVSVVCSPQSGDLFNVGITPVTCNGTDSANTLVSRTFSVTVNVSTCGLDCPADKTVNESSPGSGTATVTYATPTTTGCPTVTIVCNPASNTSFLLGTTQVNCTATDQSSSVLAICSFSVTVTGSSTCTITCPDNITGVVPNTTCPNNNPPPSTTPCATVNYATPTKSVGCSADPVVCNPPTGSSFAVGTTTVHCSATDPSGNVSSCSFTVTVIGGTPCVITCPSTYSIQGSSGCGNVVTYANPTTTGPCGDPNDPLDPNPWSCSPPSGSVFPVGTTAVTCVTDVGTQCSFNVTIAGTDAIAPVITACAASTFALADSSCQAPLPNVTSEVEASDNCTPAGLLTVTQNPLAGTLVGTGSTTIVVTVKDANNNSATCSTTFTLFEATPPTALCKPFTVVLNAAGNGSITAANVDNGSTDNCAIATRTVTPSTFTCANKGANTVTLTVTDPSGNSATCQATVMVVDNTPPAISCPANIANVPTEPGTCAAHVNPGTATATDNCDSNPVITAVRSDLQVLTATYPKGTTTITWTATDASGNHSSCQQTITVIDTEAPAINCLANIIVDFDPAVNGAVVTYVPPVGTDNCPGAVTTQIAGLPSGATFPAGTTTNTFKVTDAVGLTAQCSFKVTVALTSLIGLDSVSISGAAIVDSYNSTGGYPATKGSLANVLSNGTITVSGSSKVFGNVRSTRAGVVVSGTSQVTGNATAGTTVSVIPSGVVGGTITNNLPAPVMTLPSVTACAPYSPNIGITGTYSYNTSTGDLSLSGINIATLANGNYCFHNVTLTNSAQLKVNGPVVIKITGSLSASGATSLTNTTAIPANLRILSSFSGSNGVTLSNGTSAYLVIYAPNTNVTISGSAPLFGTVAGKTLTVSNSGMIHYDTLLKSIWPDIWSLIP